MKWVFPVLACALAIGAIVAAQPPAAPAAAAQATPQAPPSLITEVQNMFNPIKGNITKAAA
jgi:hypothetical protein